jgi:hypothetical protein
MIAFKINFNNSFLVLQTPDRCSTLVLTQNRRPTVAHDTKLTIRISKDLKKKYTALCANYYRMSVPDFTRELIQAAVDKRIRILPSTTQKRLFNK